MSLLDEETDEAEQKENEDGAHEDKEEAGPAASKSLLDVVESSTPGESVGQRRGDCKSECRPSLGARLRSFCLSQFLPIGLGIALLIGLAAPLLGQAASAPTVGSFRVLPTICICFIFFFSGLALQTNEIAKALQSKVAILYAFVSILLLTPLAGFASNNLGVRPREFGYGMAVFCCVPTTLTSGVALVRSAGGNGVLALLLTVGTNLLGVVTVPFAVGVVLTDADVRLNVGELLLKLLLTVLTPLVLGKIVRDLVKAVAEVAKTHKKKLSLLSNFLLICIVWMTISRSAEELRSVPFQNIVLLVGWGLSLHFIYLAVNGMAAKLLKLESPEWIAVVLLTSEKTLPVSITVLSFLPESAGEMGLLAIPPIVGHMSQLVVDSFLAAHWQNSAEKKKVLAATLLYEEEPLHIEEDEEDTIPNLSC